MKKKIKLFIKSWLVSSVVTFCLLFGILGSFKVYENTRAVGFGEYVKAVEITREKIKIFDFYFSFS